MLDEQDKVLPLIEFTFNQRVTSTHTYFENTIKGYYTGMELCSGITEEETSSPVWLGAGTEKVHRGDLWARSQRNKNILI